MTYFTYKDEKENIVYAKEGNIFSNNQYHFQLINGFKISFDKNEQIEKLEFLNYVLKIIMIMLELIILRIKILLQF